MTDWKDKGRQDADAGHSQQIYDWEDRQKYEQGRAEVESRKQSERNWRELSRILEPQAAPKKEAAPSAAFDPGTYRTGPSTHKNIGRPDREVGVYMLTWLIVFLAPLGFAVGWLAALGVAPFILPDPTSLIHVVMDSIRLGWINEIGVIPVVIGVVAGCTTLGLGLWAFMLWLPLRLLYAVAVSVSAAAGAYVFWEWMARDFGFDPAMTLPVAAGVMVVCGALSTVTLWQIARIKTAEREFWQKHRKKT